MNSLVLDDCSRKTKVRKGARTLVVDDSPTAAGAIRVLLGSRSEVDFVGFAADGIEGVAKAEELQPDLILMDLQMPRLDGLGAVKLIRNRLLKVRIIIITVNYGTEAFQVCMDGGADGFVTKDRLYQDLLPEIQRVLDSSSSSRN